MPKSNFSKKSKPQPPPWCKSKPKPPPLILPLWPPTRLRLFSAMDVPVLPPWTHYIFQGDLLYFPETDEWIGDMLCGGADWSVSIRLYVASRRITGAAYGVDLLYRYWSVAWDIQPVPDPWYLPLFLPITDETGSVNEIDWLTPY